MNNQKGPACRPASPELQRGEQTGFAPILMILLTTLPLIGFYLGMQYKQGSNLTNKLSNIEELRKKVDEKEEEIQLLLKDSGKAGESSKTPYSFQSFGVYSPLFNNREVTSTTYIYKRQTINEKNLTLEENSYKNPIAGVIVWEYTSASGYTSAAGRESINTVIFGGYENYGLHPTVIDPNPKDSESYTNSKNLKMYWGYKSCPKSICRVTLSFFSQYTPGGHPIYTQIWTSNLANLPEDSLNSPGINKAKEKLKKIAETIEDFSTHH